MTTEPTAHTFRDQQLLDATFEHVDLSGARFHRVDLSRARFHSVDLADVDIRDVSLAKVRMRGVELMHVEVWGELDDVRVNGIDIAPLVSAELDRLHPERLRLRPTDVEGFREAWSVLDELWSGTVERARRLGARDPGLLHESVDGEWSFLQTLRHLPFATSSWLSRAVQGDPSPWHPLELPWDEMRPTPGVPQDRDARPGLDEVLELRRDRFERVRTHLASLTDEELAATATVPDGPGWPPAGEEVPVKQCLETIINEEWWHRQFAERDLALLEAEALA
ncbi:DinB family protein [Knoellia sp. Soil729]|uniref:DinB family protein n=1 Tax=Knoellia sp. Soil729 TaxID=1736394 RepID=UPI0006F3320B|nr:DinB family protein [Knoellia sp. Soil729]KRE43118.1 hypothetical protein ASG74_09945 [Knoellia sp. Soil729]